MQPYWLDIPPSLVRRRERRKQLQVEQRVVSSQLQRGPAASNTGLASHQRHRTDFRSGSNGCYGTSKSQLPKLQVSGKTGEFNTFSGAHDFTGKRRKAATRLDQRVGDVRGGVWLALAMKLPRLHSPMLRPPRARQYFVSSPRQAFASAPVYLSSKLTSNHQESGCLMILWIILSLEVLWRHAR